MNSLNYGEFIAAQYGRDQGVDNVGSPSYNSPPPADGEDDNENKHGSKLMVQYPGQSQRLHSTDSDGIASPDIGENSFSALCRHSSDSMVVVPQKRRRGRPRKLNPDGSFATNHIPLSNSVKAQQYNRRYGTEHARNLVPELCQHMYKLGWMAGTGGSFTIRQNRQIYITPSGVSKERLLPQDLFVLDDHGNLLDCPVQEKKLKMSDNAVVFLAIYSMRNAGSIIHSHSSKAVMVTLLYKEQEFQISHQETIKGMIKGNSGERYSNDETLVIPIIENLPSERDLTDRVTIAIQQYPMSNAVLIRRHGLYVWGDSWQSAKSQAECLDYLFDLAIEMHRHGIDPSALPTGESGIVD